MQAACCSLPITAWTAEAGRETQLDLVRPLAELAPHGELRIYPGTHFEFYDHCEIRERVLQDQIDFPRKQLTSLT